MRRRGVHSAFYWEEGSFLLEGVHSSFIGRRVHSAFYWEEGPFLIYLEEGPFLIYREEGPFLIYWKEGSFCFLLRGGSIINHVGARIYFAQDFDRLSDRI